MIGRTNHILKNYKLTTVCQESACPNRSECYARGTATFMILGDTCTRACHFCNVKSGRGKPPDPTEAYRIARAIKELSLRYVVITSVDRDDLSDFGSKHFSDVVREIYQTVPSVKIELLTPDFKSDTKALDQVIASEPYKVAHNEETVRRISAKIRPQSDYDRSLDVLNYYAKHFKGTVKSSLMVGLGEKEEELIETMNDLFSVGVRELTIGQYLQPSPKHTPVIEYYPAKYFDYLKEIALKIGFEAVASGILVRSSYYAEELGRDF